MNVAYFIASGTIYLYLYWLMEPKFRKWLILAGNGLFLLALDQNVFFVHLLLALVNFSAGLVLVKKKSLWPLTLFGILNLLVILLQKHRAEEAVLITTVSLSYFTLVNIGYLLEVYRGQTNVIKSFPDYYIFSGFFPCLSMGPIERAGHLLPQLTIPKKMDPQDVSQGLMLISLGLFKKFVVSNRLWEMTHPKNLKIHEYLGGELWVFYLIALIQIYCDFSGYIDMARGFARLMGISLSPNFNRPYLAKNVANIWQRWNITLVEWLRVHFYTPVLMKTKNIYFASWTIMIVVGLWHGLSSMFFAWSLYWCVLYSLHIWLRMKGIKAFRPSYISIPLMILAMAFSTIFYHARNFKELYEMFIKSINLLEVSGQLLPDLVSPNILIGLSSFALILLCEWYVEKKRTNLSLTVFSVGLNMATIALCAANHYLFIYMRY